MNATLEWTKVLGQLLISWPMLILIFMIIFREEIRPLLNKYKPTRFAFGAFSVDIQKKVEEVADEVKVLRFLVTTQFDKFEVAHLRNFANDSVRFDVDPNSEQTRTIFRLEIKHLLGQDLIKPIGSLERSADLFTPGGLRDVKMYFEITERGRYYLTLYDEFGKESPH